MRIVPLLLAGLLLVSCERRPENRIPSPVMMAVPPGVNVDPYLADAASVAAAPVPAASAPPSLHPAPRVPVGAPQLAYSYEYGLSVASRRVRALVAQHERACAGAGPAQCQVVGSTVEDSGDEQISGELNLRAAPAWLKRFRDGLAGDAKSAGGRVYQASVTSEDLSREIIDTDAALRAKTTLRDRLQALLASHPGKLSDLLDVERELARVQGEIDSTQSELAAMRGRVATSDVTISYKSETVFARRGVWAPITEAVGDFLGIVATTLALMVRAVAWLLPWVLIIAFMGWLFRKRLARLRWPTWRKRRDPAERPPVA